MLSDSIAMDYQSIKVFIFTLHVTMVVLIIQQFFPDVHIWFLLVAIAQHFQYLQARHGNPLNVKLTCFWWPAKVALLLGCFLMFGSSRRSVTFKANHRTAGRCVPLNEFPQRILYMTRMSKPHIQIIHRLYVVCCGAVSRD